MPGSTKLRYVQLGREATGAGKGTEVDATVLWMGLGAIEDVREVVWPEENVGYLSGTTRQYVPKVEAQLHMDEVEATFEQLPYIFDASIERVAATAEGSGYGYEWTPATTAQNEITTYTIEAGDDEQEEQFLFGFVEEFTLAGVAGEAVMLEAEWIGREVAPGTKTAGLTAPTVEEILMSKGKLYIDGTAATHGTTQIINQWLEFELTYTSGVKQVYTGDGEKYFSFTKMVGPEIEVELTMEHDTGSVAEKAAWRANTTRLIRMVWTGSTLATTGTTYDAKTLQIDLTGKWDAWDVLEDEDGNSTITGTFIARYDPVAAHFADFTIVNNNSTL